MADVRALLRQQRAARRITHPLATYSDAGKLLCTLCRDQIRAEAHWDAHLLSDRHKKLLAAAPNGEEDDQHEAEGEAEAGEDDARATDDAMSTTSQKRKLDDLGTDDEDLDMDHDQDERRKRNKPEASDLSRKKSTMPSQGVEVQIPSRSSTPIHHREHSSSSSVHSQPATAAIATTTTMTTSLPSRQASNLATPASSSSMMSVQYTNPQPSTTTTITTTTAPTTTTTAQAQVDEDEWAAFEADIAATTAALPSYDDATISRPAMTAEESALAKEALAAETEAQNPESRKSKADADIEDEREEATRALEDEFEEMQELEARVQRLKEKREALLRTWRESLVEPVVDIPKPQEATVKPTPGAEDDETKENVKAAEDVDDTEAEDDEDDEDDWDGFRFRTGR
ncbi:hypothetical protein TGAMA5MH_08411 [Trichoderma gamsii]|uniref:Coiled-coil domain-containing protein 16 n=1 Tax=Trichoderma gamsii TaxID=398673 RepID=A0A2K0T2K4_9HYPO|nr:hypothetical protein TGAMA5MH_08411 [Trichoderma gamsii]